jgi:hypothetical protein
MFKSWPRLKILLLAFWLSLSVAGGGDITPSNSVSPQQNGSPSTAFVTTPGREAVQSAPASPTEAENLEQRWLLLGLMAVLIGIAAWRRFRRRSS